MRRRTNDARINEHFIKSNSEWDSKVGERIKRKFDLRNDLCYEVFEFEGLR